MIGADTDPASWWLEPAPAWRCRPRVAGGVPAERRAAVGRWYVDRASICCGNSRRAFQTTASSQRSRDARLHARHGHRRVDSPRAQGGRLDLNPPGRGRRHQLARGHPIIEPQYQANIIHIIESCGLKVLCDTSTAHAQATGAAVVVPFPQARLRACVVALAQPRAAVRAGVVERRLGCSGAARDELERDPVPAAAASICIFASRLKGRRNDEAHYVSPGRSRMLDI